MAELVLHHGIDYPDNEGISLSDIAATLLAHERLLPVVTDILQELVPGISVESATIKLNKLQSGSLSEAFFVALFIAFQEDLENHVPDIIGQVTGSQIADKYDTIVTVLFIVAIYAGFKLITNKTSRSKSSPVSDAVRIEGDYATYINITADTLNLSPDTVRRSVDKAIGRKRAEMVARAAIDFFRPAKRGGDGRIVPRGLPPISKESVAEFPSDLAFADLEKDTFPIPIPRGTLRIRATDRDKSDKGWGGKIEFNGSVTKRLPLVLAPGVDSNKLASVDTATVEAVLENKVGDDGRTKPYRIHVMRILRD